MNTAEIKQCEVMYLLTFSYRLLKFILCLKAPSNLDSGSGYSRCRTRGQSWATDPFSARDGCPAEGRAQHSMYLLSSHLQ